MAGEEEKSRDFYAILDVKKECSVAELRNAYKKLALKWHPDRFSANPSYVEEAKKKFQAVQQAYSVLSDANKRFLYDIGMYEDDDDENGMGDFMNEMVEMMCQTKSNENGNETFEELQELFVEMFASDMEAFSSSSRSSTPSTCSSSSQASSCEPYSFSNMRNSSGMNLENLGAEATHFQGFCIGVECLGNIKPGRAAGERIHQGSAEGSAGLYDTNIYRTNTTTPLGVIYFIVSMALCLIFLCI